MSIQYEDEIKRLEKEYQEKLKSSREVWLFLKLDGRKYKYGISNHGRIKNLYGEIMYKYKHKEYEYVKLYYDIGVRKNFQVHRLVAMMFIPIPKRYLDAGYTYKDLQVNHIDGIPYHNGVWNLEWCTPKENTHHAFGTGLAWNRYGQYNEQAILDNETVDYICEQLENGIYIATLEKQYHDICRSTLGAIMRRENWINISKKYNVDCFPTFGISGEQFKKEIFHQFNIGTPLIEIAKKYNLKSYHIRYVRFCYSHQYIKDPFKFMDKELTKSKKQKLTYDDIHKICKYLEEGCSTDFIKSKMNVTDEFIRQIRSEEIFKNISSSYTFTRKNNSFDDETIHAICKDIASGEMSGNAIGRKYGVSGVYIRQLRQKEFRTDITNQYNFDKFIIKEQLPDSLIHDICKDISSGEIPLAHIAKKYNVSPTYISDIRHHRKRKDISKYYNF